MSHARNEIKDDMMDLDVCQRLLTAVGFHAQDQHQYQILEFKLKPLVGLIPKGSGLAPRDSRLKASYPEGVYEEKLLRLLRPPGIQTSVKDSNQFMMNL